jgi:hypothetical protein
MSSTQVPALTLGDNGWIAPDDADILAGRQADINAAFGSTLNPALNTPQGQLATSEAAIIAGAYATFMAVMAGVDPATSSGRMQDAIARIYYLTRNPAESTVVEAVCSGKTGTVIPVNAQAVDQDGNLYLCTQAGTIPAGGSITLPFACAVTGPIACPAGFLERIYQAIPGWDSVENPSAGVVGTDVESPADFEYRRQQSVALNANSTTAAVRAAVLAVPGVIDAYALENPSDATSGATFTGSIAGNVLTVTGADGVISVGDVLLGSGVVEGTLISSFLAGSGGNGTYALNIAQTVAGEAMACAPGGVQLKPHSIYVAAYGGSAQAIGAAILTKKNPGCDMNGNTTVTVQDTSSLFTAPYPSYQVSFQIPAPTGIKVAVSMQNNGRVPSTATAQIQAAVVAAFNGTDGGERARIAGEVFAARFYAGIVALGAWAQLKSVKVGIDASDQDSIQLRADQIPTLSTSDITVTFG